MNDQERAAAVPPSSSPEPAAVPLDPASDSWPPGDHPLEVAARQGFGPLSDVAQKVWHGHATPCVSCGQLVYREDLECPHCSQDLSEEMLERMRAHAGPWYVYEHVRPFPGVSYDRLLRQLKRGVLTETSIVRGPATHHQWRFAVETPGLCRFFGRCWHCHEPVTNDEKFCTACLSSLDFDEQAALPEPPVSKPVVTKSSPASAAVFSANEPGSKPAAPKRAPTPASPQLEELSQALQRSAVSARANGDDSPPRIAGIPATWVAALLVVAVIVAILMIAHFRTSSGTPLRPESSTQAVPVLQTGDTRPTEA